MSAWKAERDARAARGEVLLARDARPSATDSWMARRTVGSSFSTWGPMAVVPPPDCKTVLQPWSPNARVSCILGSVTRRSPRVWIRGLDSFRFTRERRRVRTDGPLIPPAANGYANRCDRGPEVTADRMEARVLDRQDIEAELATAGAQELLASTSGAHL